MLDVAQNCRALCVQRFESLTFHPAFPLKYIFNFVTYSTGPFKRPCYFIFCLHVEALLLEYVPVPVRHSKTNLLVGLNSADGEFLFLRRVLKAKNCSTDWLNHSLEMINQPPADVLYGHFVLQCDVAVVTDTCYM